MIYTRLKHIRQTATDHAAWNRFCFFAFSNEQFMEGVKKVNAKKDKTGKWMLVRIPGGGFLNPKGLPTWHAFWDNWDKYEDAIKKDDEFIINGLIYEYGNYEAALGMGGKANAEAHFPGATREQKHIAWQRYWKDLEERDIV